MHASVMTNGVPTAPRGITRAFDQAFSKTSIVSNVQSALCHNTVLIPASRFPAFSCTSSTVWTSLLTYNSGTDSYTGSFLTATMAANYFIGKGVADTPGYLYMLKNNTASATSDLVAYKIDATAGSTIVNTPVVTTSITVAGAASQPLARDMVWLADPYLLVLYSSNDFTTQGIAVLDKTALTVVGTAPLVNANCFLVRFRSTGNVFFITNEKQAAGYGFSKTQVTGSPTAVSQLGYWAAPGTEDIASLWPSPLMGIVYVQQNVVASLSVTVVNAYTMTTITTFNVIETANRHSHYLLYNTAGREYYATWGTAAPGTATLVYST